MRRNKKKVTTKETDSTAIHQSNSDYQLKSRLFPVFNDDDGEPGGGNGGGGTIFVALHTQNIYLQCETVDFRQYLDKNRWQVYLTQSQINKCPFPFDWITGHAQNYANLKNWLYLKQRRQIACLQR